jgi:hypothetical protein
MKKFMSLLLCAVLLVSFTGTAYAAGTTEAAEEIDVARTDCSLTVSYSAAADCGETLEIKLHQIAVISADFQYTLRSPYPQVKLNGISTQSEWSAVSDTLGAYITADQIVPLQTICTDTLGQALFTDLCPGLYYVEGCTFTSGRTTYTYAPFLVAVPELGTDGAWNYNAAAVPKHKKTTDMPDPETKEYTVVKVWKTASGASHPGSVKVELYKNGSFAETQTLSAANNWMYTWTDDTDSTWTVVERDVPDGYTVSVSGEYVITIINSADSTPGTDDSPRTGDTQSTRLYVLLLAASGIGLIVLALLGRRKKNE